MRTRRLCELTVAVVALHAIGWQFACGGMPRFAPAHAGTRWVAVVSVRTGARVHQAPVDASVAQDRSPTSRQPFAPPSLSSMPPASGRPLAPVTRSPLQRAGAHGALQRAAHAAPEWPVYPTRTPPSATLHYALFQHGGSPLPASAPFEPDGDAELEWTHDAASFSLRLTTTLAGRSPREWQSTGGFDTAGVAPSRLVEREHGRDKRAINFDHDIGRVRFSGASDVLPIASGAQDRWSWVAQLAAIAEAASGHSVVATHWDLQVAGLHGELERWTFQVLPPGDPPVQLRQEPAPSKPGVQARALLHVLRAGERPYDLRVEAWLSPALHHLPAGLRMSTPPGAWELSLWERRPLISAPPLPTAP